MPGCLQGLLLGIAHRQGSPDARRLSCIPLCMSVVLASTALDVATRQRLEGLQHRGPAYRCRQPVAIGRAGGLRRDSST
jgi:hypothetical protein